MGGEGVESIVGGVGVESIVGGVGVASIVSRGGVHRGRSGGSFHCESSSAGLSHRVLVRLLMESGSSGHMKLASSGHCRSAALCVRNTVGRSSVSTIAMRRLLCLNLYGAVPCKLAAKCWRRKTPHHLPQFFH